MEMQRWSLKKSVSYINESGEIITIDLKLGKKLSLVQTFAYFGTNIGIILVLNVSISENIPPAWSTSYNMHSSST